MYIATPPLDLVFLFKKEEVIIGQSGRFALLSFMYVSHNKIKPISAYAFVRSDNNV